jgi:hypothetical protein
MRKGLMYALLVAAQLLANSLIVGRSRADVLETAIEAQEDADQSGAPSFSTPKMSDDKQGVATAPVAEYRDSPLVTFVIIACLLTGVIMVALSIRASRRAGSEPLLRL